MADFVTGDSAFFLSFSEYRTIVCNSTKVPIGQRVYLRIVAMIFKIEQDGGSVLKALINEMLM